MQRTSTRNFEKKGPALLIKRVPKGILTSCGPDCYNSVFGECHCICHGSNHSQGYDRALQNTFNIISRLKKEDPDIQLSLHSKRKLGKLVQLKILPADD